MKIMNSNVRISTDVLNISLVTFKHCVMFTILNNL
jgi:hypothetical protein